MVIDFDNKCQKQLIHKDLLLDFWKSFLENDSITGGNKIKREALKANLNTGIKTRQERLGKLQEYSQIVLGSLVATDKNREAFNQIKHTLHRANAPINKKCFVCLGPAHCRHHIIQLQHGGMNHKKNVVSLCNDCHAEVHPWLSKNG